MRGKLDIFFRKEIKEAFAIVWAVPRRHSSQWIKVWGKLFNRTELDYPCLFHNGNVKCSDLRAEFLDLGMLGKCQNIFFKKPSITKS
jgi:hypothetical protein